MGLYTRITRHWLEHRFATRSATGVYHAHMPIYGFGSADAEGNQVGRLARVFRILRELDGLSFTSLLDVGGAEGFLPHLVRTLFGAQVTTSDLSHQACRRARELFGIAGAAVDSTHLPFRTGAFDVVVCSEVLEHVENPVETLLELQRVAARAVILTTEELRYDRAEIDAYLFRRPGWPHMERNLFHPTDLAPCLPGARLLPQMDQPPPKHETSLAAARTFWLTHTHSEALAPGRIGVIAVDPRDPHCQRARRHTDTELLDRLLATTIAPGSHWPAPPPLDTLLPKLCAPRSLGVLRRDGDHLVDPAGMRYPVVDEVPDFVRVEDAAPSRAELERRVAAEPPPRAAALLALRDRMHLPDRWPQDAFDFRDPAQRRGFWPNDQLLPRTGGEGFAWRAVGGDPWVVTPCLQRPLRFVEMELRVHAPDTPVAAGTGQVFWKGPDDDAFAEARSVKFVVPNDGQFHVHRIELADHPLLPAEVQWLRLDPIDGACEVDLRVLRLG
ncbi:MAG: class I SAM-dependent methyltransferase [Planctomycetes bacterium]|nr:class I SAM-dependent methyltransferase [Planctomycetota bacterium]